MHYGKSVRLVNNVHRIRRYTEHLPYQSYMPKEQVLFLPALYDEMDTAHSKILGVS